jgi:hypothetical protein
MPILTEDYDNESNYIYDSAKLERSLSTFLLKLQTTSGLNSIEIFDNPANVTHQDPNKTQVTGGVLKRKPETTAGLSSVEPFDVDGNVTHQDNTKTEVSSGSLKLKNQLSSDVYAYWRINETIGTNLDDLSDNSRDGTASGTSIVAGKLGNGRSLNGTSDYVSLGDIANFEYTQTLTVSAWIYVNSTGSGDRIIISRKLATAQANGWSVHINAANQLAFIMQAGGSLILSTRTVSAVPLDQFVHVAVTYTGNGSITGVSFYVNGSLIGSSTISNNLGGNSILNTATASIGSRNLTDKFFDGILDEIIVETIVQPIGTIQARYNSGTGLELSVYVTDDPYVTFTTQEVNETDELSLILDNLAEVVTKSGSDDIKYVVSTDGGVTWQYWSGAAFTTSDSSFAQANDLATINTNKALLVLTSKRLMVRAIIHASTDALTPSLQTFTTTYDITNYSITDPYVDLTVQEVDESDESILTITNLTESVTKPANTDIQYVVTTDSFVTTQYWSGLAWIVSDNSFAQSNDLATILANIGTLNLSSKKLGVRAILRTTDKVATPELLTFTTTYSYQDYPTDNPKIKSTSTFYTDGITNFVTSFSFSGSDTVKFTLEINGQEMYWSGAAWVNSDGTYAQTNTEAEVLANLGSLPLTEITTRATVRAVAYLHSDNGITTPSIDSHTFTYNYAEIADPFPTLATVSGYIKDPSGSSPTGTNTLEVTPSQELDLANENYLIEQTTKTITLASDGYFEVSVVPSTSFDKTNPYNFVFKFSSGKSRRFQVIIPTGGPHEFKDLI